MAGASAEKFRFRNGAGLEYEYIASAGDKLVPKTIRENIPLRDGATGVTLKKWVWENVGFDAARSKNSLQLVIPVGARATDLDIRKTFDVTQEDEETARLVNLSDGYIVVASPAGALSANSNTTAAQAPFAPKVKPADATESSPEIAGMGSVWLSLWLGAAAVAAITVIVLVFRTVRQKAS